MIEEILTADELAEAMADLAAADEEARRQWALADSRTSVINDNDIYGDAEPF